MVPVLMPPNEVVEAMGRGTIDATTTVPAAIVDFRHRPRSPATTICCRFGAGPLAVFDEIARNSIRCRRFAQDVIAKILDPLDRRHLCPATLGQYNDELITKFKADPKRIVTSPSQADVRQLAAGLSEGPSPNGSPKSPGNAELLSKAA